MDPIFITRKEELKDGWRFIIEVGTHEETKVGCGVTLDREYYRELTLGKFQPERLMRESFRYLLLKTSMHSVVRDLGNEFNLRNIQTMFYSYERRMKMALFGTEYPESLVNNN